MDTQIVSFFNQVEQAITSSISQIRPPEGTVYACGFWLFYCDYTFLGCPCFAYNIVGNENEQNQAKWSPSEWLVDVDDTVVEAIKQLYIDFSGSFTNKSDEEWNQLINYQWNFFCKLCRKLQGSSCFAQWSLSPDFVVGIFEERESEKAYEMLVRGSVGESLAKRLQIV